MRVYLDAAPVIYLIERVQPFAPTVEMYLSRPGLELAASDLTRLECRVKLLRDGDHALLAEFDIFFATILHELVPLSCEVMDRATELRARLGLGTPDAIHIAAGLVASCDVFLTSDRRLNRAVGIQIEVI